MCATADEKGYSALLFAILLPVILAFVALCVDGATLIYYRISLETSADAATLAAIDAYDREIWSNERRVILIQDQAEQIVMEMLAINMPEAELVSVEIPPDTPNTCRAVVKVHAPLHFLQIFGVKAKSVSVVSLAHGYS